MEKIYKKYEKKLYSRLRRTVFIVFLFSVFLYSKSETQNIYVTVTPALGVDIYQVNSEETAREVIDLGHFNSQFTGGTIKIATVKVNINMVEDSSSTSDLEFQVINLDNLNTKSLEYGYSTINFIGQGEGNITLKTESFRNIVTTPEVTGDRRTLSFSSKPNGTNSISGLTYEFDLVVILSNILEGTMNGYSPTKGDTTSNKAYVNLKDIVINQIRGNTGM